MLLAAALGLYDSHIFKPDKSWGHRWEGETTREIRARTYLESTSNRIVASKRVLG
jgi:hypothetical protein